MVSGAAGSRRGYMGPMHRMYGTLDAELEVQRTVKKSLVHGFLVSPREGYRSHDGARGQQRNH